MPWAYSDSVLLWVHFLRTLQSLQVGHQPLKFLMDSAGKQRSLRIIFIFPPWCSCPVRWNETTRLCGIQCSVCYKKNVHADAENKIFWKKGFNAGKNKSYLLYFLKTVQWAWANVTRFSAFYLFVLNLFIHWESQIFPRWLADPSAQRALLARKRRWQLTGWADKKQAMLPQIPRKEAKRTCQTSNQNSHNRFLEMVGQILSSFCKAAGLVRPHVHNSNSF